MRLTARRKSIADNKMQIYIAERLFGEMTRGGERKMIVSEKLFVRNLYSFLIELKFSLNLYLTIFFKMVKVQS